MPVSSFFLIFQVCCLGVALMSYRYDIAAQLYTVQTVPVRWNVCC